MFLDSVITGVLSSYPAADLTVSVLISVDNLRWADPSSESKIFLCFRVNFESVKVSGTDQYKLDECSYLFQRFSFVFWQQGSLKEHYFYSAYSRCYAMTARCADIPGPFGCNCSIDTFPRQKPHLQLETCFLLGARKGL
jgi:hypothetical protein